MLVKRVVATLCVLACGCGPRAGKGESIDSSWLIGVYSNRLPTSADDFLVDRYTFFEDGSATWQKISFQRIAEEHALTWEAERDDEVSVYPAPYVEGEDLWYIVQPGADCNTLNFTYVRQSGSHLGPSSLYRGEVCTRLPDEQCHSCYERYWCDEAPPACEEP